MNAAYARRTPRLGSCSRQMWRSVRTRCARGLISGMALSLTGRLMGERPPGAVIRAGALLQAQPKRGSLPHQSGPLSGPAVAETATASGSGGEAEVAAAAAHRDV